MTQVATTFAFCVACAGALLLTGIFRRLSIATALRDLRDLPGLRKSHHAARSQVGGLAVLVAWLATVLAVIHVFAKVDPETSAWIGAIIPPLVLVACVGLVDDVESVGAGTKFAVEVLAAALLVATSGLLSTFGGSPWYLQLAWYVASTFWLVGLTNATNFIDGLDGLASGVTAISALGLALLALLVGDQAAAIVAACTAGVSVGFLRSNVVPARVFLGDTGSLFLGMALATVGLRIFAKDPSFSTGAGLVLLSCIAWGDFVFAIARRSGRRIAIWRADSGHLHHRLVRAGLTPRHAVVSLWVLATLGSAAGVATFRHSYERLWAAALLLATLPVIWAAWRGSSRGQGSGLRRTKASSESVLAGDRAA